MADKQINVELTTSVDLSGAEDLKDKIDEIKQAAEEGISLDNLKSEFEDATAEVERLQEELANIEIGDSTADFDEVSSALEEAAERAEEFADALNNIDGSNADAVAGEFDEVSSSAEEATSSVDGLQGSMDLLEASALMSISSELSNMGASAEGMAQEMNTAAISVGQLSTNVGMAEPQMVSLINNISNATFPQNEAMAYVNVLNQMGVSADKLGDSATNMDRINDATEMGYSNVMLLTQGLQAMGISADNLPASFNAIAYAEANVGGGAETLQQLLKTQAGTLNEYGMNVDATVVALSALQSQTGLTGRKLSSELGSRLKDCNGDVRALEQSLGLQAGALQNASETTGEYSGKLQELADEEAEHKTFLDQLGAAWDDFALANSGVIEPLLSVMGAIGQAGSFAVGINGLIQLANSMRALSVVTYLKAAADQVAAGAQWLLNAAMSANPVFLVVIAIAALVAALVWAYYNVDWFREMVDNAWASLVQFGQYIYGLIAPAIQWLGDLFNQFTSQLGLNTNDWMQAILGFILFIPTLPLQVGIALVNTLAQALGFGPNFIQTMTTAAANSVTGFLSFVSSLPGRAGSYLSSVVSRAISFASNFASNLLSAGSRSVSNFMGQISRMPGQLQAELSNMLSAVGQWAATLPQKFWDAGVNAVKNFLSALGIASPGTMQRMMVWEVSEMARRVPEEGKTLVRNIGTLGSDIVDNFNPTLDFEINPKLDFETGNALLTSNNSNGAIGQTLIFNFDGAVIDSEERMDEIYNYISKRINWDNTTAGRTV